MRLTKEEKEFEKVLKKMKTKDVLKATQKAKKGTEALLEDQGIGTMAIFLSEALVEFLRDRGAYPDIASTFEFEKRRQLLGLRA
ncbi:MAG: hypothetical protein FJ044_03365 [Candidatus Cloacimonetes bacterium]|nr:hypothetical protein [Candidatus Cloacimonadota bacterium]